MEPETGQEQNIGTTPTITTNQLEQTQAPISLPEQPIQSFIAPSVEDQQSEQQVQQQQSNVDELLSSIQSSFGNLATQGSTQVKLEEQAGVGTMSKELTDVENEIRQKALAFRREQESIQTVPGLTQAQRNARLGDVSRRNNMELADLEVIRQARSNSLSNAQSMIDRKVELQFGDERRRLEGLQFIYDENKDKLTQKQNELLQSKIKKEERAFELAKDKYQTLEQEKLQLVRNAQANGAGNGVMNAILKSQSLEDAYRNAGSYGMSIDDKIKRAQLSKLQSDMSAARQATPNSDEMDKDTEFKKLKGMSELEFALTNYQQSLDAMGAKRKGSIKGAELDTLYQEVLQAYRAAKDLGALQGADLSLVDDAIKRATFEKSGLGRVINVPLLGIPTAIERNRTEKSAGRAIKATRDKTFY